MNVYREGGFDRVIISEILEHKCYDVYKQYNANPLTIIDLGAHIGIFTIKASFDHPNARIWSWEICSENFNILQLNITKNDLKNVKTYELGVGSKSWCRWASAIR